MNRRRTGDTIKFLTTNTCFSQCPEQKDKITENNGPHIYQIPPSHSVHTIDEYLIPAVVITHSQKQVKMTEQNSNIGQSKSCIG